MAKKLFLLFLIVCGVYAARESYYYFLDRQALPIGATIGGVDVGGLNLEEAGATVARAYGQPITLVNPLADNVQIAPVDAGFELDLDTMLQQAEEKQQAQDWWIGYIGYLLREPLQPISVTLQASHDVDRVYSVVQIAAEMMQDPAKPPRLEPQTLRFLPGEAGYRADVDLTASRMIDALYDPQQRSVELNIVHEEAPPLDMVMLQKVIEELLSQYPGLFHSVYIRDLQTGAELSINGDVAVSGLSMMKLSILIESYRAINGAPSFEQQKLLNDMIIESSNYTANLLLDVVAGQDNAYLGSDILTDSMQQLGLENTFIVTPYEEPPRAGIVSRRTPANSVADLVTDPDPSMQSTAEEVGTLLTMIYDCANGGGALLAVYGDQLSPSACQSMLDLLVLNVDCPCIRAGVPEGVRVAHKHGYGFDIHGDGGIVFSPGGDYVLVMYLSDPGTSWLVADITFPIMRELSRIAYNFFNQAQPATEPLEALDLVAEEESPPATADGLDE